MQENPLLLFSVLFVASNILIYWISPQTRDRYLYQFMPFILLLLAWGYEQGRDTMPLGVKIWNGVTGLLLALTPVFFAALPFIKPLWNDMALPWVVSGVFFLLSAGVAYGFFREKGPRMFWVILGMLVVRAGYNYAVLPHHHQAFGPAEYISHVQKMHDLSGGEPIRYTGWVSEYPVNLDLPLLPKVDKTLFLPTHMHHQLHYYFGKLQGRVFLFDAAPESGKYYIVKEEEIGHLKLPEGTVKPLYRFKISYDKAWIVLFRMP
jgi:hypothetical protein